jgi:ABC-type lipoprotein release transport system permease subunit
MPDWLPISTSLSTPLGVAAGIIILLLTVGRVPLGYNLRNLVVRWRVTVMTLLAFVLVLGLLIVMLAFVNGMSKLAEGTGHPGNVIVLSNGATDELMSNLSISDVADVDRQPGVLRNGEGQPLCSREIYVVVAQQVAAAPGERPGRRLLQVRGVDDAAMAASVRDLALLPGGAWCHGVRSMPKKAGSANSSSDETVVEAVVGEAAAKEWGLDVGEVFDVGPRHWLVVGITKSAGTMFGSEVWADCRLVGQLFNKEGYYTSLVLRTQDADSARTVSDDLVRNFKKAALSAEPERSYYAKLSETNQVFLYSAYVVATIMAVGGVFGIMNTMFAAISQRTKDISVLRIIGFARWQVLVSFFLESLIIALIGGCIGCVIGSFADGWTVTSFLENRTLVFRMIVDANTLALGMLFTFCMGGLGGLVPALSAMRIKPLEALR